MNDATETAPAVESKDDAIRALLERLGRRNSAGGVVIERAAILAEGADCTAVVAWIAAHDGEPEAAPVSRSTGGGLHGGRLGHPGASGDRPPARYVLPAGALD